MTYFEALTFAMDNSGTAKEHVGRTYAGVDGYCPLAAYLGAQGFCLELALRPGTQHSAIETEYNIERVLPLAAKLTQSGEHGHGAPLLFRADSGFDSARLMCAIGQQAKALGPEVAFIIKWNPRTATSKLFMSAFRPKCQRSPASAPYPRRKQPVPQKTRAIAPSGLGEPYP